MAENPVMFVLRVVGNIVPLARSIGYSLLGFPMAALGLVYFLITFGHISSEGQRIAVLSFIALALTLFPYLLIGYYKPDYYILLFLCVVGVMAYTIQFCCSSRKRRDRFNAVMLISLIFSLGFGLSYLIQHVVAGIRNLQGEDSMAKHIEVLRICHEKMPAVHYIFMEGETGLAARYGAVTGYRAAFIPKNFKQMPEESKQAYLQYMRPYALLDSLPDPQACPVVH
jgi:hypothetical protein